MQLTVSLAQMQIALGDPAANLKKADEWSGEAARRGSDLIVFPEMWTTGCDWPNIKQLATWQDEVIAQIAGLAKKHHLWINGSMLALDENGQPSNTSILFDPHGEPAGVYRKIHLFGVMEEDQYLAAGQTLTTVETPWGTERLVHLLRPALHRDVSDVCFERGQPRVRARRVAPSPAGPLAHLAPRSGHRKSNVYDWG
jgi:predicted amidohydrolase